MGYEGVASFNNEIKGAMIEGEVDLILEHHKNDGPNAKDFVGIYSEEEIRRDLQDVVKIEGRFSEEGGKKSKALESTIVGMAGFDWFGVDSKMGSAHKFDDLLQ